MVISIRPNAFLSRLKALITFQRYNHSLAEGGPPARFSVDIGSESVLEPGQIELSKWRKLDSRTLGITRSMISESSLIVLKILQSQGFEAYLVGGCVRDLLLNKIPKDFDVITTAALKKIRKQFHRAEIIGRRFPICRVHVKGSVIEVSSFETVAKDTEKKQKFLVSQLPQMPRGCDELDIVRWRNCMHRDFTINSLFFNPFVNEIYDYANGMRDLRSLKLRTLLPAQLSFKEDCARILRGFRIAARLGLSFSKEIETAIHNLSSSIKNLDKSRLMMELGYMMSYGAAEPSLCLLWRFDLLEILLPFHAAYLAQQASKSGQSSMMLKELFLNMDRLFTCDRPSDSRLWVGLLAFHLALVNNPQHHLVVLAFASVLYHGKWKEGVKVARQHAQAPITFEPEISEACNFISDDELAKRVTQLALLVQDSIDVLTERCSLFKSMARFPGSPCSGLVFVSKKMGNDVAELFNVLVDNVESHTMERKSFKINYNLLGKGNVREMRFVLGKIIVDTMGMGCGVVQGGEVIEENDHKHIFDDEQKLEVVQDDFHTPPYLKKHHAMGKDDKKRTTSPFRQDSVKKQKLIGKNNNLSEHGISKKQKAIVYKKPEEMADKEQDLIESKRCQKVANKHQKVVNDENDYLSLDNLAKQQEITEKQGQVDENEKYCKRAEKHLKVIEQIKSHISQNEDSKKQLKAVDKCHLSEEDRINNTKCHLHLNKVVSEKNEKHQLTKEKGSRLALSSLFKRM